jgi:hypothetical protein
MRHVDQTEPPDRARIRTGLAIVCVAFVVALVLFVVLDSGVGRAVMGVVMFTAVVRAFILTRSLRRR